MGLAQHYLQGGELRTGFYVRKYMIGGNLLSNSSTPVGSDLVTQGYLVYQQPRGDFST